ncbi:nucleotidyltransferase domain-containing protein [Fulvivirga sp. 29W222]|uniref:Nucleotidyltransferase domain-containing protein n=2 Tax=Fulvivirga marina TaxID=2494733 RepID=A0A937G1X0_9BACT|nr:nucleotidyltransferase domain-containing protein [Fulvivirga marina]
MTIEDLRQKDLIIYECLSGSHAYGLSTQDSDVDIKGVFILPEDQFFGLSYVDQVSDEKNDTVYYELKRFIELLSKSNPNILELLYSPEDCIISMHPLFASLRQYNFLSRQCKDSFGGYAMTQIRKAKGLNKKILNPVEKKRKGVLDFCFAIYGQGSVTLKEFLNQHGCSHEACGLAKIPHMADTYGLYIGSGEFKGVVNGENANDITLSHIPVGMEPVTIMSFNKSAYSSYCKEYKAYWEWVERRNDKRYRGTMSHGMGYDAKNMMHTLRLLNMCEEIGRLGQLNVRREDREYLLKVKNGYWSYDDLISSAQIKIDQIERCYQDSDLPEFPDVSKLDAILINMRKQFYNIK